MLEFIHIESNRTISSNRREWFGDILSDKVLEIVKAEDLPEILGIFIYGSLGRNEGALVESEHGIISLYNDLDLLFVVQKPLLSLYLEELADTLKKELSVEWIDISQKSISNIRRLRTNIFTYDLRHGSRQIYGDIELKDEIPSFQKSSLTLKDAEVLYYTRLWTFMGSVPTDGFTVQLSKGELMFFKYQMAKAVLAVVDSILLRHKMYSVSYSNRVNTISKICPGDKDFVRLARWALNVKLEPCDKLMSPTEVCELYVRVAKSFLKEFFECLSEYYTKNIHSTHDLISGWRWKQSESINYLKHFILTGSKSYFLISQNRINQSMLLELIILRLEKLDDNALAIEEISNYLGLRSNVDMIELNRLRIYLSKIRNIL